jgi:hypothetical protein
VLSALLQYKGGWSKDEEQEKSGVFCAIDREPRIMKQAALAFGLCFLLCCFVAAGCFSLVLLVFFPFSHSFRLIIFTP